MRKRGQSRLGVLLDRGLDKRHDFSWCLSRLVCGRFLSKTPPKVVIVGLYDVSAALSTAVRVAERSVGRIRNNIDNPAVVSILLVGYTFSGFSGTHPLAVLRSICMGVLCGCVCASPRGIMLWLYPFAEFRGIGQSRGAGGRHGKCQKDWIFRLRRSTS